MGFRHRHHYSAAYDVDGLWLEYASQSVIRGHPWMLEWAPGVPQKIKRHLGYIYEINSHGNYHNLIWASNMRFTHTIALFSYMPINIQPFKSTTKLNPIICFWFFSGNQMRYFVFLCSHVCSLGVFVMWRRLCESLSGGTKRKSSKYASISCEKWTEKMFDSPSLRLSDTVSLRRWCGLTAPLAGHFEECEILLKGMSGKPEAIFKVERWN